MLRYALIAWALLCNGPIAHAKAANAGSNLEQTNLAPAWLNNPMLKTSNSNPGNEIIGGALSNDRLIVGIVVQHKGKQSGICSGLRIAPQVVLTAAHCFCRDGQVTRLPPLVTNQTYINSRPKAIWIEAVAFQVFPGWSCKRSSVHAYDLALIYLADSPEGVEPLQQSVRKVPKESQIKLQPSCNMFSLFPNIRNIDQLVSENHSKILVSGYGYQEKDKIGTRNEVELGVSSLTCRSELASNLGCRSFKEFILGAGQRDFGRRDACGGDSGGPAFVRDDDGKLIPVGVVSRGVRRHGPFQKGACGAGGIYTHIGVPEVQRWLVNSGVRQNSEPCLN